MYSRKAVHAARGCLQAKDFHAAAEKKKKK